jgi:hypothetical protein
MNLPGSGTDVGQTLGEYHLRIQLRLPPYRAGNSTKIVQFAIFIKI